MLNATQILAMQDVRRWHTRKVQKEQSVAEHSHGVALLALQLAPQDLPAQWQFEILHVGLTHDAHETVFGDTPYPAKKTLLLEMGMNVDRECRKAFWGKPENDPWETCAPLVRELVDLADILEAALCAKHNLPELAGVIHCQAVKAVRDSKLDGPVIHRALEMLGEVEA